MIERAISEKIRISARQVPVVTVLGPRQAGKTTLVRDLFPDYTYVNLEDRVTRELYHNRFIPFHPLQRDSGTWIPDGPGRLS